MEFLMTDEMKDRVHFSAWCLDEDGLGVSGVQYRSMYSIQGVDQVLINFMG